MSAFAPGHITGLFVPELGARDPRGRGSRGAGIVLELGVTAEASWDPAGPRRVTVAADVPGPLPISDEVARRLVAERAGRFTVRLTHQLPVGQGFGMSAAGAVATGLAVADLVRLPRQRALEVAHLADLFGGGGLGGVAAILGGGLEVRLRPGVPPYGRVRHRPFPRTLLVGVVGRPIPSPRILRDPRLLRRISAAAADLPTGAPGPTPVEFLSASERFTDATGLASAVLNRTLRAVRTHGGWAAQAMFGNSFFAVPRTKGARTRILVELERRGVRAVELAAATGGATVLPRPTHP
jgi:pantoate kinase